MKEIFKTLYMSLSHSERDKNVNIITQKVIKLIEANLELSCLSELIFKTNLSEKIDDNNDQIFDFGIERRIFDRKKITIEISAPKKFLACIILREIYAYCFIPKGLRKNITIQVIIHQIIINELKGLKRLSQYDRIAKEFLIEFSFLEDSLDRIAQFIKSDTQKRFIFNFLRDNYEFLKHVDETIYIKLFYEKNFLKYDSLIPDDDLIETIRILIDIFYKIKEYDSLKNYKRHFKDMKTDKKLIRNISLRKFSEMVSYLRKYYYIAPEYQLNWPKIKINLILCTLKFPESINLTKKEYLEKFPFSLQGKESRNKSSFDLSFYSLIPEIYLEDFISFLRKLKNSRYLINNSVFLIEEIITDFLNLNYFREFNYPRSQIINPLHEVYDEKYEIEYKNKYSSESKKFGLNPLEFLIIDRIRWISITGFGFERKRDLLSLIESDLFNLIIHKRNILNNLTENVQKIQNNQKLKEELIQILESNKNKSFFTLLEYFLDLKYLLRFIQREINNESISVNQSTLNQLLEEENFFKTIKEAKVFRNKRLKKIFYKYYYSILLKSNKKLDDQISKIEDFYNLLSSCRKVKIFKIDKILQILKGGDFLEDLFFKREKEIKIISQTYEKLSVASINNTLNNFLKEGLIKPHLTNTIFTSTFTDYFPQLILKENQDSREIINRIKNFFPRLFAFKTFDLVKKKNYLIVEFYIPPLIMEEKKLFVSIIYNLFKDAIIGLKRFFFSGILETFSLIDYYNFGSEKFEYNPHLFLEYYNFIRDNFEKFKVSDPKSFNWDIFENFWLKKKDMYELINIVKDRVINEKIEFNPKLFKKLIDLHLNLDNILLNKEHFMDIKKKEYFNRYVDNVLFIPIYQSFGLSQYFLYIYPKNLEELDYKLLFLNTFQEIQYPAELASSIPLFIKYVFPYRTPNKTYLNWLVKSKKAIREYVLFHIQKIHFILNFNYNLQPYGWYVDYKKFKTYLDNILVNKDYHIDINNIKVCNVGKLNTSAYKRPTSKDYKHLLKIHDTKPTDIKSLTSFVYKKEFQSLQFLLNKGLIRPFLKLKNLDFKEVVYLIVPDIKKEDLRKIIQAFNFFNYCFIYEIAGEYFIQGKLEEKTYENGVMVELYLPGNTQIGEFFKLFDLMFSVLKVENYIIMHDLVDGESLIANTFKTINFSEYNPLNNLKWNDFDKKWRNPKIFDEHFQPIYPDLIKND